MSTFIYEHQKLISALLILIPVLSIVLMMLGQGSLKLAIASMVFSVVAYFLVSLIVSEINNDTKEIDQERYHVIKTYTDGNTKIKKMESVALIDSKITNEEFIEIEKEFKKGSAINSNKDNSFEFNFYEFLVLSLLFFLVLLKLVKTTD